MLENIPMSNNIRIETGEIEAFCKKWRVRELSLFGSVLRPDFHAGSDIDVLISFEPGVVIEIDDLLDMKEELERLYGRPVDLIEREALRNPWRMREIMSTREVLYAS
jgi:predicted nucleotidyltransferase